MASKLDNTNVKYRKVPEGPEKKTGIEQLEQMKDKKRASREAFDNIDNNILKNVKMKKATTSTSDKVSIQELSDSINKNITVFKSRDSAEKNKVAKASTENKVLSSNNVNKNSTENKNSGHKKFSNKNSTSNSTVKERMFSEQKELNKKNDLQPKNEQKNSVQKKLLEKNIESKLKKDSKLDDHKVKKSDEFKFSKVESKRKLANEEEDRLINSNSFMLDDRKKEVTDISESSKVRRQVKRRANKKRRKEKIEQIKERVKQINFKRVATISAVCLVVVAIGMAISMTMIHETIIDEGANYSKKQVENMVIDSLLDHNSVYLFLKYRYSDQEKIPFVEYIDVDWVDRKTVEIKVYDKSIIACTNFMNEYIYFDKDGLVVETSAKKQANIHYVTGLDFSEVKLNDKIKVQDDKIFDTVLSVTQQINKYNLDIKEINFDDKDNMILYTDNITILMGKKKTYDEQLAKLKSMLEKAKKNNLKGIMHMENYVEGQNRIIFNKID